MRAYTELVKELENRKGLPASKILEAMGESLKTACKRIYHDDDNIKVRMDEEKCMVGVVQVKEIVDDDERIREPNFYLSLSEARKLDPESESGDFLEIEIDPLTFGLREAQIAKNKFIDSINRYELSMIENEYKTKVGEIIGGDLQRRQKGTIYVNLGKAEGILPIREQSPRDKFNPGDRIKCLIKDVRISKKKEVKVILSRTDPQFVKKLFEQEIPEIYDKTIEIKGIAREPGKKTKVIVHTKKLNVDPVGACVGMKGVRIQSIVQELNGEMIDVVRWSDNPKVLLASLFKPAAILYIAINEKDKKATVVVNNDQLSLAIGNKGLNAKLAARASGWSIDLKTEDQFEEVRKQEEDRIKAEEALGLGRKSTEKTASAASAGTEEVEYEIDESYSLTDLGLPDTIQKKLEKAGYDKIEKLIDIGEAELMDKAGLTVKQAQKVVGVMKEVVDVVEEEVEAESETEGNGKNPSDQ
jgi:N utilization substance protein A